MRAFIFLLLLGGCKEITSTVVGGTIGAGKEVVTGVKEGVEEGRKQGASVDGAVIVTTLSELQANGGVTVYAVRPGASGSEVVLAFENTVDQPMRLSGVDVMALDADGFVIRPVQKPAEITVPPHAKDQMLVQFPGAPEKVAKVRVWEMELPVPGK